MCLAIPGKVVEIDRTVQPIMGNVSFGGVQKRVCVEWIPELQVGDYVIVHVGFAISKVDEKEALETLQLFKEMDELESEGLRPEDGDTPAGPKPS